MLLSLGRGPICEQTLSFSLFLLFLNLFLCWLDPFTCMEWFSISEEHKQFEKGGIECIFIMPHQMVPWHTEAWLWKWIIVQNPAKHCQECAAPMLTLNSLKSQHELHLNHCRDSYFFQSLTVNLIFLSCKRSASWITVFFNPVFRIYWRSEISFTKGLKGTN